MNITKRLLIGFAALLLLVTPVLVLAQDDDELPEGWEEFTDEDEVVYIAFPEGYFAGVDPETPGSVAVANSEELLARLTNEDQDDDPAVSGDQAILLTLFPAELMGMMGMEVTEETGADVLLEGFATLMATDTEDPWTFGEAEVGEDEDGQEFGFQEVSIPSQEIEGYLIVTQAEGVVLFGVVAAFTGEFTDEWFDTGLAIIETYDVDATAEELMEAFMGGAELEATEEAAD